ncbi:hypothetical protein NLJ89_g5083 [Agrocybe chaxingu]|uniref:WD40 repeat-like protein n=1 Tax=Agrocybe chaxingu TaxID=84603 RepID=A0A9W8K8T8_9AGAR|nr:hypothetical protein NLJ89_g5083 [Agrocybe chaxingu]
MTAAPIVITADEINCLIYSYFQDAGFNHSAFALRNEGRLQNSPYFAKHIQRGELIELLGKALLYLEVESHWRGDELTTNCKSGFSLLEPHVCSTEPPSAKTIPNSEGPMGINDTNATSMSGAVSSSSTTSTSLAHATSQASRNGASALDGKFPGGQRQSQSVTSVGESNSKRKMSPVPIEGHVEKRARHASVDMDVDNVSESGRSKTEQDASLYDQYGGTKALAKPSVRPQGPGDTRTDPRVMLLLDQKTEVFVCAWNPTSHHLLASGSKDGVVNLWNLPDPPPVGSDSFAEAPGEPVPMDNVSRTVQGDLTSLDWNPQGTLLAIGSYDCILRVLAAGPIFATRFSKNGAWLLSASLDGTTCLWDVKEKRLHKQYRCHKGGYCCLDVEWLNETTFASAGADMRVYIMRVDEDEPIKSLTGHKDEVNQIRVNPSGTRLASCSDDGTAYVWKVDNLSPPADTIPGLSASDHVVVLKGHSHSVSTVGWCVDHPAGTNELLATSSFDGTARIWDSVTGQCLHVFQDHRRPVYSLTFSPDGKYLATGSGDGWLHIYHTRMHFRVWSWYAGSDKPGVFEIDWQNRDGVNRIAMALECRQVAVLDVNKLPILQSPVLLNGLQQQTARIEPA